MKTRDLITTAISNTFRSKLRTTLTVLALFVGAFTLTLTTAVGAGVTDYVTKQVASLGAGDVLIVTRASTQTATSGPKKYDPNTSSPSAGVPGSGGGLPGTGASDPITDSDLATLAGIRAIKSVQPVRLVSIDYVVYNGGTKYELTVNPTSSITRADLESGAQLDNTSSTLQLMLPSDYVSALGFAHSADAVGATVQLGITDVLGKQHSVAACIVGVARTSLFTSDAGANQRLIDTLADLQAAGINVDHLKYSVAIAHFDTSLSTDQVQALKHTLSEKGYNAQTIQDQLGIFQTVINGITGVLDAFAIVALLAAAFGIVNTLLMSVQERTREIGLMKALGMSSGRVFALFSLEAVFIGFLGSAIGAVIAIALGSLVDVALASGPLSGLLGLHLLLFNPLAVVSIILLIMAIAFVSGTLPARRAARQNPIEALRYE